MKEIIIKEYASTNAYRGKPKQYTIEQHEGNSLCGDDITVYLTIQNNKITKYSFDGNCSIITKAAGNFLGDLIHDIDTQTVLGRDYKTLQNEGFEVSPRRKRAAVIAIMATQNAIYRHKGEEKRINFDELLYN